MVPGRLADKVDAEIPNVKIATVDCTVSRMRTREEGVEMMEVLIRSRADCATRTTSVVIPPSSCSRPASRSPTRVEG